MICSMYVYFHHVIIIFCYKVKDSRKKIVKLVIVQAFDWLRRYLVYYLCMDECGYVGQ